MLRIGVDTGGTFTDFVAVKDGVVSTWKQPSTPDDPSRAILEGLRALVSMPGTANSLSGGPPDLIHGSTVATNALLEGKTASVAFVTNRGFEDLLEIGRQARPDLYNFMAERPTPLVPRSRRFGVTGRLGAGGDVVEELRPLELEALAERLAGLGVEAVAVCLLHSYADPSQEERVAAALQRAGLSVTSSAALVREYREYERASTAVVNAAVSPVVSRYLGNLQAGLEACGLANPLGFRVMGSNGGALSPGSASTQAVRTVLSGPAAGVRAAEHVGRALGRTDLISFDMGGTSTDVSLLSGSARTTSEAIVAGHPVRIPTMDIHTVGAGGGSIAWRDAGGALRVGPESAGAEPGPACYARGGPPTVTDANLVLGRIVSERFLDGRMPLDVDAARRAVAGLAESLGTSLEEAAEGIVRVAEETMARAIRVISLHRGHEPADFSLLAFGGAGGLHAASLAETLEMPEAVVPADPGVFSAYGMTVADIVRDRSASSFADLGSITGASIEESLARVRQMCREDLAGDGVPEERMSFESSVDMRYRGQSYELNVELGGEPPEPAALREEYHRRHQRRYGYHRADERVELVTLRVRGVGRVDAPPPLRLDASGRSLRAARMGEGALTWRGQRLQAIRFDRARLPVCVSPSDADAAAASVRGPALILEAGATIFIAPRWRALMGPLGHIVLGRETSGAS